MTCRKSLATPLVAAAVAMIVVANFCVVWLLAQGNNDPIALFETIWPIALVSTTAIILVMSFLYEAIQEILAEMARREQAALELSTKDPLTGLANRIVLNERLCAAIDDRRRSENFAIHMLDLDHFKRVNDVLGHQAGDYLLKEVAHRLRKVCRDTDTIARLGGDEFVILQCGLKSPRQVKTFCERLLGEMQHPFCIEDRSLIVGMSIGSIIGGKAGKPADFLRKADIALYRAKLKGRNCFQFFSEKMDAEVHRHALIESELRTALDERRGLEVHFQPQIGADGQQFGLEALLRWRHPTLGQLGPSEIIPIAEDVGLIDAVGEFVMTEACKAAQAFPKICVAVNLSPRQFARTNDLPEVLSRIARRHDVDCSQIELEITEHVFIEEGFDREQQISTLREMGFRISLDDFGTGYSSLSYLRRFEVDKIKLDKSFFTTESLASSIALLRGVVTLAHSLGLFVVAEGIETAEQEQVALEAGCDGFQGFRYGQPAPLSELASTRPGMRAVA